MPSCGNQVFRVPGDSLCKQAAGSVGPSVCVDLYHTARTTPQPAGLGAVPAVVGAIRSNQLSRSVGVTNPTHPFLQALCSHHHTLMQRQHCAGLPAALLVVLVCSCSTSHAAASGVGHDYLAAAEAIEPWLVSLRRELHQIPELIFEEHNTSALIRRRLDELNIPYKYPYAKTGLVGTIGKGKPIVALRSDIDALPILEPEGLDFRSKNEGAMHACGHDGHMTMLLGAARLLKEREEQLKGTVLLVFQPAEEGGAGADVMIQEGALEGVDAAFGVHVMPMVPTGSIAVRSGTIMAGALSFHITITGRGGHAAMPHMNIDPIVAASNLVGALQVLVSRETPPLGSAVVSVTLFQAGEGAYNVIPDSAALGGTVRALTHEHMMYVKGRIEAMVPQLAAAYGCNGTVDWRLESQPYYPPTVNDVRAAALVQELGAQLLGPDQVFITEPIMPAEDFAFIARTVPSAFYFLGIRNETLGSIHGLHSNKFKLDENALYRGAALQAALATEYLARGGFSSKGVSATSNSKDEL